MGDTIFFMPVKVYAGDRFIVVNVPMQAIVNESGEIIGYKDNWPRKDESRDLSRGIEKEGSQRKVKQPGFKE
jgi:hypothetical protein